MVCSGSKNVDLVELKNEDDLNIYHRNSDRVTTACDVVSVGLYAAVW